MRESIEVRVPDIGDFKNVPVIEILVKPGDAIKAEQALITLESDKATMEVPAPRDGVVESIAVRIGDKVSQDALILTLAAAASASEPRPAPPPVPRSAQRGEETYEETYDVVVIGAGPGGYSAAFRAADLGLKTALVERYPTLGGVCLNVGCIPSKALLHVAAAMDEAAALGAHGIAFGAPRIDLGALRDFKTGVVRKLTNGLAGMARARKVDVVHGTARFADARRLVVGDAHIAFKQCIIAAGSRAVRLPFLPDDPRVVDSTGALALPSVPGRMLVIGGGIIGMEMANVYSALGARIDVVEMTPGLMQGADRDLVKVWEKKNAHRFDAVMLETKTAAVEARADGLWVTFEGKAAPQAAQRYDLILQAAGRVPNGREIDAEKAGVIVDARGFIPVDTQMRTNVAHIFAIGDIAGNPMLAHKAVHEGHVAAEAACGLKSHFDARVIPAVAYTDPQIAWAGLGEDEAKREGRKIGIGKFPWAASGRAIANGRDEGFTKLIFDEATHRIVGGGIVGTHAGDLIGEIALAIEMGADAADIAKTIHPHPTLSESIAMAAEVYEGTCTDLPPGKPR